MIYVHYTHAYNDIGIYAEAVIITFIKPFAQDRVYLDPVAVVAAIRTNIYNSAETPENDVNNTDTSHSSTVAAISNSDRAIAAELDASFKNYAANISAHAVAAYIGHVPNEYTSSERDDIVRHRLATEQFPDIKQDMVNRHIESCL